MSSPFTVSGTVSLSPDLGSPTGDRAFTLSGTFDHKVEYEFKLTGSGTQVVNFGSLTSLGAKLLLVEVDPKAAADTAAPINLIINGGDEPVELAQGGSLLSLNPTPSAGILSLSIVYTQNAVVRVTLLG